jgi:hypothetical protein
MLSEGTNSICLSSLALHWDGILGQCLLPVYLVHLHAAHLAVEFCSPRMEGAFLSTKSRSHSERMATKLECWLTTVRSMPTKSTTPGQ